MAQNLSWSHDDASTRPSSTALLAAAVFPRNGDISDTNGDEDDISDEEAVFNLSESGEESEDEDDEDEDDDEDDRGRLAELKKQEKRLRAKLQLQQGEGEDLEDQDEEDDEDGALWGAKKRAYYDADEQTDDEEALKDEGEEALRLQRAAAEALHAEDFEEVSEPETSEDEDEDVGIETLGNMAAAGRGAMQVEEVEKDLGAMTTEQQRAAVMADAPELAALLADLQSSLAEVRSRVGPLLKEVRAGQLATVEGISYLEVKHLLLLHYCIHLVFYFLLKAEGRPVADHPVIGRLVEIRAFLDRARPIDKRLRYQMDKLLAAASAVQSKDEGEDVGAEDDPLRYGPRPEELVPRVGAAGASAGDGVYRPPKLNPAAMQDDPDKNYGRKEQRRTEELSRRAARSEYFQELVQEVEGAPEELRASVLPGEDTAAMKRQRAHLSARAAVEEDMMQRVQLSKEERRRLKGARRSALSGGAMLEDFADDVAGIVEAADGIDPAFQSARVSQKFGADLSAAAGRNVRSGDADLPVKAPLHERRARLDTVRAKQAAARDMDIDEEDVPAELASGGAAKKRRRADEDADEDEDDGFYAQTAAAAQNKKAARKDKYAVAPSFPPLPDEVVEGARPINRSVEKNRGLTPHRRKDIKNPRVRQKKRFDKKSKARRGQVQEGRAQVGSYGGEATGIKAGVSKSRRF
ncbi:hypothetical protein WJX75_005357 [Coccomyxa subellipsoidea]|uniref:Sas10 C-terminal domain-containing protein n=1 Tax=Coccomyxa subellipsoidea TaxID=248742 RepID=A0ABR2YF81_9CHLO